MQKEIIATTVVNYPVVAEVKKTTHFLEDYTEILKRFGLAFKKTDYYLEVGQVDHVQGWIIDIAVIPIQIQKLFETVIPLLIQTNIPFKIARTASRARAILGGDYGYPLIGKILSIYPVDENEAVLLVPQLIELTRTFKGPEILTDRLLEGVVYTRYGGCNPAKLKNENGIEEFYIYDPKGQLLKDPFHIPFVLPHGIKWPFGAITPAKAPKKETVLQDKYKPMGLLKEDMKGFVKKGLYLEKTWRIKWCVIKEAKKNMIGDSYGRDITDRLRWQFDLHKDLQDYLPIPCVYDLFEENGDTYLVMQYIKGESLQKMISFLFDGRMWIQLDQTLKLIAIDYARQILEIIDKMHNKGYIHRDITPANFLVNKKQELWMIDLELSYSETMRKPYPPFRLGTPGYMSPEQKATQTPRAPQDIYSIGALFILLFTGISPEKFALEDAHILKKQLRFFTANENLTESIGNCLEHDPKLRPTLSELKAALEDFREKEVTGRYLNSNEFLELTLGSIPKEKIIETIENALKGLAGPNLMNKKHLWPSKAAQNEDLTYSQDTSVTIYEGFYQGLSGIIWLLARASQCELSTECCMEGFVKSRLFISGKSEEMIKNGPTSLFGGTYGIAVALAEGINSGLIDNNEARRAEIVSYLKDEEINDLGIAKGIAGQCLALLKLKPLLGEAFVLPLLKKKIHYLLKQQQNDGSWLSNTKHKVTGFAEGVAGIACMLLEYFKTYKDEIPVQVAATKAINWLADRAYKKHNFTRWPLNTSSKQSSPDFEDGCAGISLSFIKAYEVLGIERYRNLAEDCLRSYPVVEVSPDITQCRGLVGLGEVYLEANKVFHSEEWEKRTNWVAQFLLHHFQVEKNGGFYWMPDGSPFSNASLMTGNAGIIHFLLRYYQPGKLSHPFLV